MPHLNIRLPLTILTIFTTLALAACAPQPASDGPVTERERNLMHLAQTMQTGGDIPGAIDLYMRAAAKSTHRVEAHLALVDLYTKLDQPAKAEEMLLAARERQPNHPRVNLALGKLEVSRSNAQEAIGYFDAGLADEDMDVDLLNGKGVALDMLGRHTEAQAVYLQALYVQNKDNDFIQNNLAMSYIMNGDYDAAIAQLEGIANMADSAVMRQNLALAYGLKGNMQKAREWGLKDLTETQIEENIDFYRSYTEKLYEKQTLPE